MQRKQPAERRYRGFIAFQASCFLRALQPPSFHLVSPKKEQRDQYYAEEIHKTSEHKITSLERCFTHDQGLLSPFDKSRQKLVSIIQLIVRNVKQIFMRGYILQIAVLIAASGAFGDQIK